MDKAFLNRAKRAVQQSNGKEFAACLQLNTPRRSSILQLNMNRGAFSQLGDPYGDIMYFHILSLQCMHRGDALTAFEHSFKASQILLETMNNNNVQSNWYIIGLDKLAVQLRQASYAADAYLQTKQEKARCISEAQNQLLKFFQKMVQDREINLSKSKKIGCLSIVVQLLKIYFKLNNHRLCSTLIRTVNNPNFPPLTSFPLAQQVSYMYYLGRLKIFDEDYNGAEESLTFSLQHCYKPAIKNYKRILEVLIPVRLLLGKFPSETLLRENGLTQFTEIVKAIRQGDLHTFNMALQAHQSFFIEKGIYLILEKLKLICYRNLFRKTYTYTSSNGGGNKLQLNICQAACAVYGQQVSMDEIECILANLITRGQMKGYIAHERCVVLSKKIAFPKEYDI